MHKILTRLFVLAGAGLIVGCSARTAPELPVAALPVTTPEQVTVPDVAPQAPLVDPTTALITKSEALFAQGQAELTLGHLTAAGGLFDRALDLLLTVPGGARSDARVRTQYERLRSRISALEILALREGDGFTQTETEPAVIDRLLDVATLSLPVATKETEAAVAADLATTVHDLPIDNNERVQSFIGLFQTNLRDFMQESLQRSAKYLPMVQEVFRSEGIPLDLAYLAIVESGYKTNALSRAAARGMWQFMPATGKEHGLTQNWFLDERSDPEKATRAAAQYLKALNRTFDGDWNLAMASYNAGPGRLQRAVKKSRINDYWKLTATSRYLPKETRNYVPMIMAAVLIAKNPEAYGFEAVPVDRLVFDRITVPDAIDLRTVAEWTDVTIEQIRELNPELRRTTTPVGAHDLKIPLGTAPIVEARLASADPSLFAKFATYKTTKRSETLATVARKFDVTRSDLAAANSLRTTSKLRTGQSLMIPRAVTAALASRPVNNAAQADAGPVTYHVKRGDTLFGIAKQFDTTVDDIKKWNALTSTRLSVGDRLTIHRN
ncbi:MAG: transglycosylase SLT domain-containing protein [Acidobacteria bacterium]|nr:transglycosylase SLT domain-containing protein [Acidobacteriota bacterium]